MLDNTKFIKRLLHLDRSGRPTGAARERSEARSESVHSVRRTSTGRSDKVMRQVQKSLGMTIVELLISTVVIGLLLIPTTTVMIYFYGDTIRGNAQSKLAAESQNLLRSIVEELRVSSGVRASSTLPDANHAGAWDTDEAELVLIVSTPVLDSDNEFIIDTDTGYPYQNEVVYFADTSTNTLYKRYLANSVAGNTIKTSCPAASATASCPADAVLSKHFDNLTFTFYDQDNSTTTTLSEARSIEMEINMEQQSFGQTLTFSNNIRITLRNTFS